MDLIPRRSFLTRCVSATLSLPFIKAFPARAEAETLICRFYIAGFAYYDSERCITSLVPGEPLALVAEPTNPCDRFAVEILRMPAGAFSPSTKLGYVPRTDNRPVSRLLAAGKKLGCRAVAVNREEEPWKAAKVEIFLTERT